MPLVELLPSENTESASSTDSGPQTCAALGLHPPPYTSLWRALRKEKSGPSNLWETGEATGPCRQVYPKCTHSPNMAPLSPRNVLVCSGGCGLGEALGSQES